jgi:Excalibur calcium-binding domain
MSDADGPWQDYGDRDQYEAGRPAPRDARPAALRAGVETLVWRYRSAPLWTRVLVDVTAASLVLVLVVGVSLALREDGGPERASAAETSTTEASVSTTSTPTTGGPTTTLPPTTTTTVPPTTTTVARTTTTSAVPPAAPPPTEPPPPPTQPPPPTTEAPQAYRNCRQAFLDDALPLYRGEPGYGPHLDGDGDGEACEWDDFG